MRALISADHVGQRLGDAEWLIARALKINKELRVRITWFELLDELERESGFADAAKPLQTGERNAAMFDSAEQLT